MRGDTGQRQAGGDHKPLDAIKLGIAIIYQDLNLIPDLTVAENIFWASSPTGACFTPLMSAGFGRLPGASIEINADIDPAAVVGDLTVADRRWWPSPGSEF